MASTGVWYTIGMEPFHRRHFWKFVFGFLSIIALGITSAFLAGVYGSKATPAAPTMQNEDARL